MSQRFRDESSLFSPESSDQEGERTRRKRNSLGFKLPVTPTRNMSGRDDKRTGKGSGAGPSSPTKPDGSVSGTSGTADPGSGSVLGFAGATKVSEFVYSRPNSSGAIVQFNIFSDVNKGATSVSLEKIIQVLIANPSLTKFGEFIDNILYQGFDREFYIKHALGIVSVSVFCRFAILGAIRGSNFEKIKDSSIDMPSDLSRLVSDNTVIKKAKKRTDLTILRFTASIPHWVAYWMHAHGVPKKIPGSDCPAFLQFPGAASVPMSKDLRIKHLNFCIAFSALLPGGQFNANIYLTAYENLVPIAGIPADFLAHLGISSASEAKSVTAKEITDIASKQLVKSP
jgi:hypothetical protein